MTGISVLIPAYNAAPTLARALDSVAIQAHTPLEVIVVDDASTDSTAAVAAAYARLPVRLLRHATNQGAAAALNTALDAASHDLVAFLDADDEWLPGKLQAQLAYLAAHPDTILVATGFGCYRDEDRLIYAYGLKPFPWSGRDFWRQLLRDSAIHKSSVLARRDIVRAQGGFDRRLRVAEDQDLFLRLAALGPVGYVHEPLVKYHDTPGSLTRQGRNHDLTHVLPVIERHLKILGPRLTAAERRTILGERYSRAAGNLLDLHMWGPGLRLWARALLNGHLDSWRHIAKIPAIHRLKTRLAGG